ncbi:MAG: hypothetical protein ACREDF_03955 [Thermoplasmata archaeon]
METMMDPRFCREPNDLAGILADVDLECVFHARNAAEAARHRSLLEGHGIVTRVGSDSDEHGPAVSALAGLPLFVPATELERASEILARFDLQAAEWDEEDDVEEEEEEEEEEDDYFPEDDEDETDDEEEEEDDDAEELEEDE